MSYNRTSQVLSICLALGLVLMTAAVGSAGVPRKINYQGRVADSATGEPLPGAHSVVFRVYDVETLGTALWTESQPVTADTAGVFSVILGSVTPIDISFDGAMWLEVEVDSEVLSPRRELVSVPYAFHAADSDSLGGLQSGSYSLDGHEHGAEEILDEPGVASSTEGSSSVALSGGVNMLRFRTINAPAAGYVLAIGTCEVSILHTSGTMSDAYFGVSNQSGVFPGNQDVHLHLAAAVGSGERKYPVTVHGLFSVSSGLNTLYFYAKETLGVFYAYDIQFTLVYFPTAYGVIEPTLAGEPSTPDEELPQRPPMTLEEVTAEQAEAETFHTSRIERELAEIRTRLEAVELELQNQNR